MIEHYIQQPIPEVAMTPAPNHTSKESWTASYRLVETHRRQAIHSRTYKLGQN